MQLPLQPNQVNGSPGLSPPGLNLVEPTSQPDANLSRENLSLPRPAPTLGVAVDASFDDAPKLHLMDQDATASYYEGPLND